MTSLAWRDVTVDAGHRRILHGVNLSVPAGTSTAVVGPSGAGKTTLLRVAAGLVAPARGRVEVGGHDVARVPPHGRRVGLLFQQPRLFPNLDVVDNVSFALRAAGVRRRRRMTAAMELLEELGVAHLERRRIRGLSGGEQQRVAMARALAAEPALLLLDEPLSALDPGGRDELRRVIRRIQHERRLTMVYVTHDRAEAAEVGDQLAILLDGVIAQYGTPRAVFERPVNRAVATFLGSRNLIDVVVREGWARVNGRRLPAAGPDGPATLVIRPEHVELDDRSPLRMSVEERAYQGAHHRLRLRGHGLDLEVLAGGPDPPEPDDVVGVGLPTDRLWRIPYVAEATADE